MLFHTQKRAENAVEEYIKTVPVSVGYAIDEYELNECIIASAGFKPRAAVEAVSTILEKAAFSRDAMFETYANGLGCRYLRLPLTTQQRNNLTAYLCNQIVSFVVSNQPASALQIVTKFIAFKREDVFDALISLQKDGRVNQCKDSKYVTSEKAVVIEINSERIAAHREYHSKISDTGTSLLNLPLSPVQIKQLKSFAKQRELPIEVAASYLLSRMITYVQVCNECMNDQPTTTTTSTYKTPVLV